MVHKLTPPRPQFGGKNYCETCWHYNGERCVKQPYNYCPITRSKT